MKKLIAEVIAMIEKPLGKSKTYLLKLEDFDDPVIYMEVCKHFAGKHDIHLTANLEYSKYKSFCLINNPRWEYALDYLVSNGCVQNIPLTKFRNQAAEKHEGTLLLLLMGAEAALDKGSLKDFNRISMSDVVVRLKKDYSLWFSDILEEIGCDTEKGHQTIRNIFKDLFRHINVDPMKLSDFVDSLDDENITDIHELVSYIYASLKEFWDIPPILSNFRIPDKKSQKYLSNDFQFIRNSLSLTSAKKKSLMKKLDKYAENHDVEEVSPFYHFESFAAFKEALTEFLDNRNIDENRKRFIDFDFGIVTEILGLSIDEGEPPDAKDKVIRLSGEPLTVYLRMLTYAWQKFMSEYDALPLNTVIKVTAVRLSNCTSDDKEETTNSIGFHFENICTYMGGLLDYIRKKCLMEEKGCSVDYSDGVDPFDSENIDLIKSLLKPIDKWGDNSEIRFLVQTVGESEREVKKTEFRWTFSPYANWKNAFSLLRQLCGPDDEELTAEAPLLTTCSNMEELIASESEDEFFIKLESIQCRNVDNYANAVRSSFKDKCSNEFFLLHQMFNQWTEALFSHGFFNCIDGMNQMISCYIGLLNKITAEYKSYPSNTRAKIGYLLNIFNIISDSDFLDSAKSSEVIIPAYHPAMLEKIIAQNDFIVFSFSELLSEPENLPSIKVDQTFDEYGKLAAITQGVDVVPCGNEKLVCRNVWGYYALYYDRKKKAYIGNIELVPEECDNNAEVSEQSDIIYHHIMNYIRTFPSRIDGLKVSFISPTEIQYVVEGINKVSDMLTKKKIHASVDLKVICFGGTKNISGYLKYWLNNYMSKERTVSIRTSLQYISSEKFEGDLSALLENQDLCFIYDILKTDDIHFDSYIPNEKDSQEYQSNCQFPMIFIPDTIAQTHGLQRKINISQMQFLVSRAYTQLVHRVLNPNAMKDEYKVMQVLELQRKQNDLLDIAHQKCRWVVCEDRAIDRELLQNDGRRIIGFTTGEGCFGEYNITVSAREDLLFDIKKMLRQKLIGKFNYWSIERTEKAADHCIELTESFDGSRILKALNPYDYEIHNFLAYALTVKILGLHQDASGKCVLRSLINLDSYVHWFKKTDVRPDFMLIEIPVDDALFCADKDLNIRIRIIECKMSLNIDNYFDEAMEQVESGLRLFSEYWNKNNHRTNRRYWLTQLYRAIAFSVLQIADNDPHYPVVSSKIYNILSGNIHIEWSGEIFAFDLRDQSETVYEETLTSETDGYPVTYHKYGQIAIQKLLMPSDDGEPVLGVDVSAERMEEEEYISDEETAEEPAAVYEPVAITPSAAAVTGDSVITEQTESEKPEVMITETEKEPVSDNAAETDKEPEMIPVTESSGISKQAVPDVRILLGRDMKTSEKIYWEFGNPGLNNRHLLINGNSGCGKTYCIQGLLMSSCLQGVSSIVFDYTGGFTEDKLDAVFLQTLGERIKSRFVYVEGIPVNPFKKGIIRVGGKDYPEKDVIVAQRISEIFKNVYAFGSQQTSAVYQAVMTCFKRSGETMTFGDVYEELSAMKADTVVSKIKPFIDLDPFVQGETFDWTHIRDTEESVVYIFQFDGFPRDVQVLLTEILLWDIWNFCVKTGSEDKPLVLVMDEAQNLSHKEKSPSAKILTEGRKFGISGWYATQFMKPQLSDDEIQRLQQSGQKLYFCPPDDGVDTVAKNLDTTSQGKAEWSSKLKKLRKGECVSSGNMVIRGTLQKYPPRTIKVISLQERTKNE